jgi:hypothetical protein
MFLALATYLQPALLSFLLCTQHLTSQLSDVLPGELHMGRFHRARADGKTQHELVSEVTRNHVDFLDTVYSFQKGFAQSVGTLKRIAKETNPITLPKSGDTRTEQAKKTSPLPFTLHLPC